MADAAGAPSDDGRPAWAWAWAWNEAVRSRRSHVGERPPCVGRALGRLTIGHAARCLSACLPMRQGARGEQQQRGDCWSAGDGWPQRARHMTSPGGGATRRRPRGARAQRKGEGGNCAQTGQTNDAATGRRRRACGSWSRGCAPSTTGMGLGLSARRLERTMRRFWGGWARLPHRGSAAEAATALDGASAGSGLAGAAAGRNSRGACTSPAPALPAHPWIAASSPALTSCPLLPGLPQVPPQVPSIPTPSPSLHTQGAASPTRQPRP
jgi:hypothetical protein